MTDQTTTAPDLDDEQPEPCGEGHCICHCGQGHVCSCDCWRCGDCQQNEDHCQCADEDDMRAERDYGIPADDDPDED